MSTCQKKSKKTVKSFGSFLKDNDSFGVPVTVNYKGESTYKSIFGGTMTIIVVLVIFSQFMVGLIRMVNREQPEYASYFLPKATGPGDPLNIPELSGQMYIGIRETTEYRNGTIDQPLIPFDDRYINSKVAFYENGALKERINLPACDDREDFNRKVKFTSGLTEDDFDKLKCIPASSFTLYNDAE